MRAPDPADPWSDLAAAVDPILARPKAQAIVDAAKRLFLENGYALTSMDAITREAGVSKATVYELFRSKEELFRATLECERWRHLRAAAAPDVDERPLRAWLIEAGLVVLRFVLSPEVIGFYRCVVAEAGRTPELGRLFYEGGPARGRRLLAAALERARARGEIGCEDPERAAVHLLGLIRGDLQIRALFGLPVPADGPARRLEVEAAVDAFLRAYPPAAAAPVTASTGSR